ILFRSFCARILDLTAFPFPLAATVSERPKASLLARKQAEAGAPVTNLRHSSVQLEDATSRRLVTLLDGTRTVDQLTRDLAAAVAAAGRQNGQSHGAATAEPTISPEVVLHNVQQLARLALLIA